MEKLIQLFLVFVLFYSCATTDQSAQILKQNLKKTGGIDAWQNLEQIKIISKILTEIGGNTVSTVSEVRKIAMPSLQRTETYLQDSMIQMIITNDEGSYFYKMAHGNPIASTAMDFEEVNIKTSLDLLEKSHSLDVQDTFFNDISVTSLLDTTSGVSYLYDKSNGHLIAQIEPSAYGTGVRHFSEFKSVGEFTFPYGEVYSVPGSGYRTIREVEEIELMPEFGSEEFLHDDRWQVIKTGETIPDFQVAIFPTGEKLAKEDLLGKTTLIDFWATWCKPCIAEFPNIRSAYERFQPSGFEVLSISLDQNQDMLESFLEEEDLPWINAYEPKGFDSELASDFQLAAIPKPILVDQNGIIIVVDKEATGEGLNKLLETIF